MSRNLSKVIHGNNRIGLLGNHTGGTMDWVPVMGYVAEACTTLLFLPQAIQIVKTKQTKDFSLSMYSMLTSGLVLWSV
ncbi:MAG TPA: PQ-loop domain-containing transporter [Nitrospirales bacterium]|nr:PQ-loop domain-containing transporter [Nitrospirales bacterium]